MARMKRSDPAHVWTDEEIKRIEKQISKEYKQAHEEAVKKTQAYFNDFKRKDGEWRVLVDDGKVTEKEYIAWRRGQMLVGKRWEGLCETLAEDYTNAAKIAMSITKEHAPEVYAVNHNYSTFEVEKSTGLDTSYTLYSRETIERMYREDPKLYHDYGRAVEKEVREGKQKPWDKRRVKSVLTQAVLQGESIPKITKRLEIVTGGDHKAAIRNARTMMTGVQNAGRIDAMKRANDLGIPTKKQWLATVDGRTRHWHRELDGVIKDIDEPFENEMGKIMFPGDPEADGANVYNCFVGDTKIATDSNIVRSYKHDYSGQLFTIKSASGIEFTCTPNHPILTTSGWVAAERLKYGDNLLIASVCENSFLGVNPDINHTFACIDAIHDFLNMSGGKRATSVMVNFHGDIPASDVEIITQKWFLGSDGNASGSNSVDKFLLKHANKTFMGKSAFVKHFGRIGFATLSFISSVSKTLSFFFGGVRHTVVHSFRSIAGGDAIVLESKTDNMSRDSKLICKGLNGSSSIVFADDIVDIKVSSVCHMPVYNLQTVNGYYFVNNIIPQGEEKYNCKGAIAHNCRCTLLSAIKGFELDVTDPSVRPMPKLKDMTYEEWKGTKAPQNIQSASAIKPVKFAPSKTIEEAEAFANDNFVSGGFNLTGKTVSYSGIELDVANRLNQRLSEIYGNFNIDKLTTLESFGKRNKKLFASHKDAPMITTNFGNIGLNSTILKSAKSLETYNKEGEKAFSLVMSNIDTLSGSQKKIAEAYRKAGKSLVGDELEDMITHEMGHRISYMTSVNKELSALTKTDWEKYAQNISGYANHSFGEYVAESFNAYYRGERDKLQPELVKVFDSLRK